MYYTLIGSKAPTCIYPVLWRCKVGGSIVKCTLGQKERMPNMGKCRLTKNVIHKTLNE